MLAIKPILEQLQDDFSYEGILSNELPFHEYTAVNKLVTWLQQVQYVGFIVVSWNIIWVLL